MNEIARIAYEIRAEIQLTLDAHPEALSCEYVHGMESALWQMEERLAAMVPITWDGKRETWDHISDLLPARYSSFIDECFSRIEITDGDDPNAPIVASIPFKNRFVRFDDSFAILPPEIK